MTIKISLTNFKCWDKKTVEIPDNGLTLLSGKSGAGKTTILEAFIFALFGTGSKLPSYGKTNCKVQLTFNDFDITRTKRPNRLVLKHNKNTYEDDAAQAIISEKFTSNFAMTGYMRQNSYNSFILLSPLEKLAFLERFAFQGTDLPQKKRQTKELIKEREKEFVAANSQLEMTVKILDERIPPKEMTFPIKCKNQEKGIKNHEKKIVNNQKLLEHSQKGVKAYEDKMIALEKLNDFVQLRESRNKKIQQEIDDIGDLQTEIKDEDMQTIKDDLEKCETMKRELFRQQEKERQQQEYNDLLTKEKERLTTQKNEIETELKDYSFEEVNDTISVYRDFVPGLQRVQRLKEEISENQLKSDVEEQLEKYTTRQQELTEKIRQAKQSQNVMDCPKCGNGLKYLNGKLHLCEKLVDTSPKELKKLEDKLADTEKKLSKVQKRKRQNDKITQENEIKQQEIDQFLEEFESTGDEDISELQQELQDMESELSHKKDCQKRLGEIDKMLESGEYSDTLKSLQKSLERLDVEDTVEIDNELLENESSLREKLENMQLEKHSFENRKQRFERLSEELKNNQSEIENRQKEFTDKFKTVVAMETLQEKRDKFAQQVKDKYAEREELMIISEKLKDYAVYTREKEEYDQWVKRKDGLVEREKLTSKRLNASKKLKETISEAESIAISNLIDKINQHVETYINLFFEDDPMTVEILPFTENKKKVVKPQINLRISYKGMDCDLGMLSGGELQRLVISFNLALCDMFDLPMVLLDECTSNLDQETTQVIVDGIKENFDKPVVMIAHQVVSGMFDEIIKF